MIDSWKKYEFSDCLVDNNVGRANQINASEIKKDGRFPVVDQGQDFIAGYSDEENKLVEDGLPYVIFGDHTRCFKFVDFPFIVGADGTKVLSPNIELFDPKYFYYQLLSFDIPSRGYNRHYKLLKEKTIQKPELPEQRKITYVLSNVQKAIEQQDKLIRHTNELKKALMQKLFTEGTKGEKQKQTEIGLVPESWEVKSLIDAVEYIDYGVSQAIPKTPPKNGVKIVSTADINRAGDLLYDQIRTIDVPHRTAEKLKLNEGDLLFNWRNSAELIGKSTIFHEQDEPHIFASFILRIKCGVKKSHNYFMKYLMNHYREEGVFIKLARRAVNQANYNRNEISVLKIPVPPIKEQIAIAKIITQIEGKINHHKGKKATLNDLFKTLLHELMTGERRVNEIEFENQLAAV
jgi:type I restriction enzyme S subunit